MYDLNEIKAIPCSEIASKHGIELKHTRDRLWGKLRDGEKTASFSINLKNNLWFDFGSGKGGSVIDLAAELEGISAREAIKRLAEEYGLKGEVTRGWRPLTDSQYRELGVQPERATINFNFDLDRHTTEQLQQWSDKYGMHVKELAEKYPVVYNKLIISVAMKDIDVLRDIYHSRLQAYHASNDNFTKEFLKSASIDDSVELNRKIDLLQRAVTSKADFNALKVHPDKDFKDTPVRDTQQPKVLSEDEKIRERIVNVYKKLFNFEHVNYFNVQQAKALYEINKVFSNSENKYMPIESIKKAYKVLGESLDKLEKDYSKASGDLIKTDKLMSEMTKVKDLFIKCNTVIEGIREASISMKNEQLKQSSNEKLINKAMDMAL